MLVWRWLFAMFSLPQSGVHACAVQKFVNLLDIIILQQNAVRQKNSSSSSSVGKAAGPPDDELAAHIAIALADSAGMAYLIRNTSLFKKIHAMTW